MQKAAGSNFPLSRNRIKAQTDFGPYRGLEAKRAGNGESPTHEAPNGQNRAILIISNHRSDASPTKFDS